MILRGNSANVWLMPRVGATYTQHGQSQRGHAVQRFGVPRVVREPRDPKLARAAPENRRTKMTKPSLEVFVRVYLSQIVSDAENTFDRDRLKASMRMLDGLQLLLMLRREKFSSLQIVPTPRKTNSIPLQRALHRLGTLFVPKRWSEG